MMDYLRRFIKVDNHEAVNVVDMEKNLGGDKMARPKSNKEFFRDAIIREGADELTLQEGEAGVTPPYQPSHQCGVGRWEASARG